MISMLIFNFMETQPMKSKKIILIRSLFTVLFCLSAVMLFGQQNNTKQPRAKQTAQVGGPVSYTHLVI